MLSCHRTDSLRKQKDPIDLTSHFPVTVCWESQELAEFSDTLLVVVVVVFF